MSLSPIVLFVYNRPWHTEQTVGALQKNELAKESELFIYSDEAKNADAQKSVDEVRRYIDSVDGFKKVTIVKREKNWGLADSIIDGVTNIINKYGKIIVLEDDLVTSPYFLRFMNEGLNFYKDENKVMHISGYVYPIENSDLEDTYFIKPTSCWGWATWDRAWKYFKKDKDLNLEIFDKKMIKDFNLNNSYNYFYQIIANKNKILNTWAIFWYTSVYLNGGLSLHPKKSFVKNIGYDGEGVHCGKSSVFDVELINRYPIKFTTKIKEDYEARKRFEIFFNSIKSPFYRRAIIYLSRVMGVYGFIKEIYEKKG